MKRKITVTLTQAEARALNWGAADLAEMISQGDLEGMRTPQQLTADQAALARARDKLFAAGMELED